MNTYGMHSIHGRAPAIATGLATTRPDLDVWVVTGDGDALSIGGNHLIHALRRNVNITILLFNNQIYGLTKGQYSPTSEVAKVTKSTPFGSLEQPFNPLSLALGAEAGFVARTHDMDRKHMMETFRRAHAHKGASFVEIYQNCNVFNDGAFEQITGKAHRADMLIPLVHGEPIRFGSDLQFGVVMDPDGSVEVVEVAGRGRGRPARPRRAQGESGPGLPAQPAVPRPLRAHADRHLPRRRPRRVRRADGRPDRRGHRAARARRLRRPAAVGIVLDGRLVPDRSAGRTSVTTHVVLMRGVNVGGHNRLPMADLRALLGGLGYTDVATYLQSGNAVCTAAGHPGRGGRRRWPPGSTANSACRSRWWPGRPSSGAPWCRPTRWPTWSDDPKRLHVTFLDGAPDADHLAALADEAAALAPERIEVVGADAYLHTPGGFATTRFTPDVPRAPPRAGGHHPELADRPGPGRPGRRRPADGPAGPAAQDAGTVERRERGRPGSGRHPGRWRSRRRR